MSEVENLKQELKRKERSSKILKAEIENLKRKLSEQDVGPLMKKIEFLEDKLKKKDKEISDLKAVTSVGAAGGGTQELKTKLIVFQSKLRKLSTENEKYVTEIEDLKMQNARLKKDSSGADSTDALKNEIEMYKRQTERYRGQLADFDKINAHSRELEKQVASLKQELAQRQASPARSEMNAFSGGAEEKLVAKYKNLVTERDEQIARLQEQLQSGGGGGGGNAGFLVQNRANRKVAELEAQIQMLKRNEADMKKRYEEAMRKLSSHDEFSGW